MTNENLERIRKLAELKIEIDRMPMDSLITLRMTDNFLVLYKQLENTDPGLAQQEIDDLIIAEIERLTVS